MISEVFYITPPFSQMTCRGKNIAGKVPVSEQHTRHIWVSATSEGALANTPKKPTTTE